VFVLPLAAIVAGVVLLTYVVVLRARRPNADARYLTWTALAVAVIGSACFILWPVQFSSQGGITIAVDPVTHQQFRTDTSGIVVTFFPNLTSLGWKALGFAGIPVGLTAIPFAWQKTGARGARVLRIASTVGLIAWLVIGGISAVSWWSYPATLAMAAAVSRPERVGR
jgi:hypothetical protein